MNGTCIIFNYNQKENAERLYDSFSKVIDTVIFDSGSDEVPERDIVVKFPNIYYGGLYQEMIDYVKEKDLEFVIFVCSDIEISDEDIKKSVKHIKACMEMKEIGIYQISSKKGGHNVWSWNFNKGSGRMRIVSNVEGFMMAIKRSVIDKLNDNDMNFYNWKYGWGIDLITCKIAKENDLYIIVDDTVMLYHPPTPAGYSSMLANGELIVNLKNYYNTTYSDLVRYLTTN